jgi:ribose-phosphate pyrophosphokinase
VIGDVSGKAALLVDDIIDTAGTLCAAATVLNEYGAREILACATHGVLSGNAIERIEQSQFSRVYVTDTIPLNGKAAACSKIQVRSVADLIARAIKSIHTGSSVSALF